MFLGGRTLFKARFPQGRDHSEKIKTVFDLAGISKALRNAVSHRLPDTLAVELLQTGVPIERVSILLGHQSVRVTEWHYNSEALVDLVKLEPALALIVDLKFFCGFSFAEIATMQGISERTVQRDWEKARIFPHRMILSELPLE